MADFTDEEALICRYANLWLSHWFWLWSIGHMDEVMLRRYVVNETFTADCVFTWWELIQQQGGWSSSGSRTYARFETVINEEFARLNAARLAPHDIPARVTGVSNEPESAPTVTTSDGCRGR